MLPRFYVLLTLLLGHTLCAADDPVFSGPQPGESLVPFQVVAMYGDAAGKQVDPVQLAGGKPTLLVFVHKLTRPGIALTRGLTNYANSLDETVGGIIWLDDDKAKAEEYLNRAKQSLNFTVPVGVSVDGGEGPGAYGLNRNVELTIVIAEQNQVKANFALVQPSVTEGPKIAGELAKLVSGPAPTAEEFQKLAYPRGGMMARRNMRNKPAGAKQATDDLRSMMRTVIAAGATEQLRVAVQAVDQWVGDDEGRQARLGQMAAAVLQRGMGSDDAQKAIRDWKKKYYRESED